MARSRRRSSTPRTPRSPRTTPPSQEQVPQAAAPEHGTGVDTLGPTLAGFASQLGLDQAAPPMEAGSGLAESHDAAAFARDGGIHLHQGLLGLGTDLTALVAHEAVHLAQAEVEGPEATESDLETEADLGADALMAGKAFRPRHATRGGRPLKKGLAEWFSETWDAAVDDAFARGEALSDKSARAYDDRVDEEGRLRDTWERAERGLTDTDRSKVTEKDGIRSERDTYYGTDALVEDPANAYAEPKRRKVGGTTVKQDGKVVAHPELGPDVRTFEVTSASKGQDAEGNEQYTTSSKTYKGSDEKGVKTTDQRDLVETLDLEATRKKALAALDKQRAPLKARHVQAETGLDQTRRDLASTRDALAALEANPDRAQGQHEAEADGVQPPEVRIPRLREQISRLEARELELGQQVEEAADALRAHDADRGTLENDPAALESVIAKRGLKVEKQFKKVEEHTGKVVTTDKAALTRTARKGTTTATEDFVEDADTVRGRKRTTFAGTETHADLKNRKFSVSAVESRAQEVEREDFAGVDKTHDTHKSTTTLDLKNKSVGHEISLDRKGPGKEEQKASISRDVSYKDGRVTAAARQSARVRTGDGAVVEGDSVVQANTDGASVSTNRAAGYEGDHLTSKVKTSASGDLTVKVTPVPGDPPTYTLVTTVNLGGRLGREVEGRKRGDAGRENSFVDGDHDAKAGAEGSAGLSARYTHTRTLSLEEARQYLASVDAVDAGKAPTSNLPEFSTWSKLKALADHGGASLDGVAAVGGSGSAEAMREGDSLSLELGFDVEGKLSASGSGDGVGVGGSVSGKQAWKRTVSVARGKGDEVIVTVSRVDASSGTAGLTGNSGHAKGEASRTRGSNRGESVKIRLSTKDPAYDTKFRSITAAATLEQVRALKQEHERDLLAFDVDQGENEETKGSISAGPGSLEVGDKNSYQERVSADKDGGTSGSFTGEQGSGAKVKAAGVTVLGSDRSAKITAEVDKAGATTVDLENKEVEHSLAWKDPKLEGELGDAGKLGKLKEEVQKAETRLSGYRLSSSDLDVLTRRAGDRVLWERCANSGAYGAWMGLASSLRSPRPDPEWATVDAEQAKRLARARALARFAQATGTDGAACLDKALRHWGEGSLSLEQEDLGEGYEWPPSIHTKKPAYTKARKDVAAFRSRFGTWLGMEDGLAREVEANQALDRTLVELRMAVDGASDYHQPRMRGELLQALATDREALRHAHASFLEAWGTARDVDTADTDALLEDGAARRVKELERVLRGLKADETRLLDEVEAELDKPWYQNDDEALCQAHLRRVDESYGYWARQVEALRSAYAMAGIDPSEQILPAVGQRAPFASVPLPDPARFNELHQRFYSHDAARAEDAPASSMLGKERDAYTKRSHTLDAL